MKTTDDLCAVLDIAIRLGDADGTLRLAPTCAAEIKAELQAAAQLRADLAAAKAANERDRTTVADGVHKLRKAIDRRSWLREAGRGSYAWDDKRYQEEFGHALDEIEAGLSVLQVVAKDWSHCPTDQVEIAAARAAPERYRHIKRGHVVTLLPGEGLLQTAKPIDDMTPLLTYEEGGKRWHRPVDEFHDGRFIKEGAN